MEVEDPISDKFRTLVEALMAKTTSEIVKVFAEVLLETRVEISRSWRKIDELKQELEQRDEQREKCVLKNQTTQVTFKREEIEVQVHPLHEDPQIAVSDPSTVESAETESQNEVQKPEKATDTRKDSAAVPGPLTLRITTVATTDSASSFTQNLEAEATQSIVKPKKRHAQKSTTECQTSPAIIQTKTNPVVDPQQPSTSTSIILLTKRSEEKGAVVTKKTYLQKHASPTDGNTTPHTLRGRQFRSQRPCLCCSSDQCSDQQKEPKKRNTSSVVPRVSTCRDCGTTCQDKTELKGHKCSIMCNRCGQSFTSLKTLTTHSQGVHTASKRAFPYRCYPCSQMFATLCGWNMHKRIHTHGCLSETTKQSMPSSSHSITVPKELNAKVEVRLERISHAQLEAALSSKGSLSISDKNIMSSSASPVPLAAETTVPTGSTLAVEAVNNAPLLNQESGIESGATNVIVGQGSSPGTELSHSVKILSHSDDVTEGSVIPSPSAQIQPVEKRTPSKSLTLRRASMIDCEESMSRASDETMGFNSRKRKLADCNHDVYNGVFPVEKILKWRNKKGQNEVRIKWMPCSLCGAKWKNTWEPAESFISYKDDKKEGLKSKDKQK
ncbi:zinc finger protein with KRAB and SCAN domains 5 [Trichomycterus rosablanca]|uniref:zinc finger protein with KRAB and SCAN domains 5 n=1 Tax=Trichomycterus rosablanca TaxID=2290929 RepID=UPI002F34F6B8